MHRSTWREVAARSSVVRVDRDGTQRVEQLGRAETSASMAAVEAAAATPAALDVSAEDGAGVDDFAVSAVSWLACRLERAKIASLERMLPWHEFR